MTFSKKYISSLLLTLTIFGIGCSNKREIFEGVRLAGIRMDSSIQLDINYRTFNDRLNDVIVQVNLIGEDKLETNLSTYAVSYTEYFNLLMDVNSLWKLKISTPPHYDTITTQWIWIGNKPTYLDKYEFQARIILVGKDSLKFPLNLRPGERPYYVVESSIINELLNISRVKFRNTEILFEAL